MTDTDYDGGLDLQHGRGPQRDSVAIRSKHGVVTVGHTINTGPGFCQSVMVLDAAEAIEFAGALKDAAAAAVRHRATVAA